MAANPPAMAAATPVADDGALKKAKIDAAMLRAQVRKLEKLEAPSDEQQSELQQLRSQLEAAEKLLANLEAQAPAQIAKPAADDGALKKAKIDAAMLRAQVRKLEKLESPSDEQQSELQQLRSQLDAAEKLLASLEAQAPAPIAKPAADDGALKKAKNRRCHATRASTQAGETRSTQRRAAKRIAAAAQPAGKPPKNCWPAWKPRHRPPPAKAPDAEASDPLKKAKIELAMKRAELKKAEKAGNDEAALISLREALAAAEQALHQAEDAIRRAGT